jgi:hypothetical protein
MTRHNFNLFHLLRLELFHPSICRTFTTFSELWFIMTEQLQDSVFCVLSKCCGIYFDSFYYCIDIIFS